MWEVRGYVCLPSLELTFLTLWTPPASMQNQMEAKLASMGLKSPALPASPSARTFGSSLTRQSIAGDTSNYLSPDTANVTTGSGDAAATLAQQRAKLKANAAHRISAPGTLAQFSETVRGSAWPTSQLGQVAERAPSPNRETNRDTKLSPPLPSSARPKSTDFTGVANSFRSPRLTQLQNDQSTDDQLSPMVGGNWASMVNTPVNPMFGSSSDSSSGRDNGNNLDAAAMKLASWNMSNNSNNRVVLDDARKFRRASTAKTELTNDGSNSSLVYGDDGEPLPVNNQTQSAAASRTNNLSSALRNVNSGTPSLSNSWQSQRSPALSSTRFGASDANDALASAGLNFGLGGHMSAQAQAQALAMAQMGMNIPGLMFSGVNGIPGMSPLGMNGLVPSGMEGLALNQMQQAQLFAAQLGYNPAAFGLGGLQAQQSGRGGRSGGRSPNNRGGTSANGRSSGESKDKDDDVDVSLLNDVPAWLRSLRLHKYTPNFEGITWRDMVVMDDAKLESIGVAALGARRKLLKTFEAVRGKMGVSVASEAIAPGGDEVEPEPEDDTNTGEASAV